MLKKWKKIFTTISDITNSKNEDSMTGGPQVTVLLQDYVLHEKMTHFNRERIPERVVHAKGTGAFGAFKLTNDISKFALAKLFSKVGNLKT